MPCVIPVIIAAAVVVLGLGAAAAIGLLPTPPGVPDPAADRRFEDLPAYEFSDRTLGSDDVAAVRFDQVLRGYRMDQVDAVLRRLGEELDSAQAELARYRDHYPPQHQAEHAGGFGAPDRY